MVDICKCWGNDCSKRNNCYRYVAKPDEYWQPYFANTPTNSEDCDYFIELKGFVEE